MRPTVPFYALETFRSFLILPDNEAMSTAPDTLPGPADVLVLSPHLDDALLSTAAYALRRPCDVWTVFAGRPVPARRTAWEETCGFADSDEALTTRWAEDKAAFAGTPARARHLGAWEGPYASRERRRSDLRDVAAQVEQWLETHGPDAVVLVPAGAGVRVKDPWWQKVLERVRPESSPHPGADALTPELDHTNADDDRTAPVPAPAARPSDPANGAGALRRLAVGSVRRAARGPVHLVQRAMHADHVRRRHKATAGGALAPNPDHIALRDLVLDLAARRPGTHVVLYEELPYLWHGGAEGEVSSVCAARGLTARQVWADVDPQEKFEHLRHYTSQMPVMDTRGRLLAAEYLPGRERYWPLSPSPMPTRDTTGRRRRR